MNENKITYEDIKKANDSLLSTDIRGKSYIEVNQRIKAFRMVYPQGTIEPQMLSNENGVCVFRTIVRNESREVLAVGHAYEKENSTFINKTSYIENCETSSVGRALGMCGFGIDTSVASYEEVENAIAQQESDRTIDKIKVEALKKSIENNGLAGGQVTEILNTYYYNSIEEIKVKDFGEIVNKLRALKGE
jgi:hypothetical protein